MPFFEEYDAMREAGYNEIEWKDLDHVYKANAVAWYRIKRFVSIHEADAQKMKMDRQARRK